MGGILPSANPREKASAILPGRNLPKGAVVPGLAVLRFLPILAGLFLSPALAQDTRNEPPRPLEGRGLDNLVAFTRLLGYVRYFHPSDAAAETDWDAFAIQGVKAVEGASSPEDLARRLEELFRPIAPTVRVFPMGKAPEMPLELMPAGSDPGSIARIAWRHLGVGTGNGQSLYSSRRIDSKTPLLDNAANLAQEVDAKALA